MDSEPEQAADNPYRTPAVRQSTRPQRRPPRRGGFGWTFPHAFLLFVGWLACSLTLGLDDKKVAAPAIAYVFGPVVNLAIAGLGIVLTMFSPINRSEKRGRSGALFVAAALLIYAALGSGKAFHSIGAKMMTETTPPARRRWSSFSLRTLFAAAGICAIAALYAMPLFSTWRIRDNQHRLDAEREAMRHSPEQAKLDEAFAQVVRNSRHSPPP